MILDMDGLLLDTEPVSLAAWQDAAAALGYDLRDDTYGRMIGLGHAGSRELLLRELGASCPVDALAASAMERYEAALERGGVPRKPGLDVFLEFLDSRGLLRAVATSTGTSLARRKLGQAGAIDALGVIVGGDQVTRGKPAPDIFLLAANRLGVQPGDCLVLEDSAPGIFGAAAAGMRSILVPDRAERVPEAEALALAVVPTLTAASEVIDGILAGTFGGAPQPGGGETRGGRTP